jgi:hypothetical protein
MSGKFERDNIKSTTSSSSSVSRVRNRDNYDTWEHAYFPYLLDMYKLTFDDPVPDPTIMYKFFRFIYTVSSGSISPFLKTMSKVEEEAYFEFKLKRKI